MVRARSGKTLTRGRKRTLRLTKGFRLSRHNLYRQSMVTLIRARRYAFRDRRVRKREFRRLWIVRVNAACRNAGISYSRFIEGLKAAGVELDRKVLADLAARDEAAFASLVQKARDALKSKGGAAKS